MRNWMLATALVASGLCAPLAFAELTLVRVDPGPKQKLGLSIHPDVALGSGYSLAPSASISSFFGLSGKRPVRSVFELRRAGGQTALAVVRENLKKKSRLELAVVASPSGTAKKPEVLASSKGATLGHAIGDGRIEAIGPYDWQGDGVDELAIVRALDDGTRVLEIRPPPAKKNAPIGGALKVIAPFDAFAPGEIVDVAGQHATGAPDLALLVRGGDGDRIVRLSGPALGAAVLGSFAPAPAIVDLAWSAHGAATVSTLNVLRDDGEGGQRLDLVEAPFGVDQPPAAAVGSTNVSAGALVGYPVRFVAAFPGPSTAPATPSLLGSYPLAIVYLPPDIGWECVNCAQATPVLGSLVVTADAGKTMLTVQFPAGGGKVVLPYPSIAETSSGLQTWTIPMSVPVLHGFAPPLDTPWGPYSSVAATLSSLRFEYFEEGPLAKRWKVTMSATGKLQSATAPPASTWYATGTK